MRKLAAFMTVALLLSVLVAAPIAVYGAFVVETDKDEYTYGEWLNVSGSGAAANKPVTIRVYNPNDQLVTERITMADAQGSFSYDNVMKFPTPPLPAHLPLGTYTVEAIDGEGNVATKTISFVAIDEEPPVITHTPVASALVNTDVSVSATVTDNVEVQVVHLRYRTAGVAEFAEVAMTAVDNVYSATIPAANVTEAGVEYYIHAVDTSGNEARSPEVDYYTIEVTTYAASTSAEESKTTDLEGATKTSFVQGESFIARTKITNIAPDERTFVYAIRVTDPEGAVLAPLVYAKIDLAAGQSIEPEVEFALPSDAKIGTWKLVILVYTDYIRLGGVLAADPVEVEFTVAAAGG